MAWIKLQIHPEHRKILRLAELTDTAPELVLACVIRWFRHVDENYASGETDLTGERTFNALVRWPGPASLVEAMKDDSVGWLELREGGRLFIPEYENHFGSTAKKRALWARRAAKHRTGTVKPKKATEKPPAEPPVLPPWMDTPAVKAALERWLTHRRQIRKTPSDESWRTTLRKLAGWSEARTLAAIEESLAQGWQGIYEPKNPHGRTAALPYGAAPPQCRPGAQ